MEGKVRAGELRLLSPQNQGQPLLAPPAAFRSTAAQPFYGAPNLYLERQAACTFDPAGGCRQPGYRIQWPYLQVRMGKGS